MEQPPNTDLEIISPPTLFTNVKEEAMVAIRNASYKAADAALAELRRRSEKLIVIISESASSYLKGKMK